MHYPRTVSHPLFLFVKKIKLTKGKYALVDDEDFDRVSAHKWHASLESRDTKWYAKRRTRVYEKHRWKSSAIRLHHFILNITSQELQHGFVVDHLNHDGLDCRKSNLEIVTQEENMRRSPGWKKKKTFKTILDDLDF